nr:MAG TPA: hypothetical protein [Caudoviricetes sp.]
MQSMKFISIEIMRAFHICNSLAILLVARKAVELGEC